jgi:hypothetical protein
MASSKISSVHTITLFSFQQRCGWNLCCLQTHSSVLHHNHVELQEFWHLWILEQAHPCEPLRPMPAASMPVNFSTSEQNSILGSCRPPSILFFHHSVPRSTVHGEVVVDFPKVPLRWILRRLGDDSTPH